MLEDQKFAFVDVETTGSSPLNARITDIAIVVVQNNEIIGEFNSLINPQVDIPYNITRFTGITNQMVASAPLFEEVADEVNSHFEGCIFVAHNARFDYGFIKHEFLRCNQAFNQKTLCTVKLSRLIEPEFRRHGLDALIERHHLVYTNRHRALDDCLMLIQMWNIWYQDFPQFPKNLSQLINGPILPAYIDRAQIDPIPNQTGVYQFFTDDVSVPIYVGKTKDLQTKVLDHFSADYKSAKQAKLMQEIKNIDFITTAGELGALLLESSLVKKQTPIFNKKSRAPEVMFSFKIIEEDDYHEVEIIKVKTTQLRVLKDSYGHFRTNRRAEEFLETLVFEKEVCPTILNPEEYNKTLQSTLQGLRIKPWPFPQAIGIIEHHPETQERDIHYFNQWHYLGSEYKKTNEQFPAFNFEETEFDFNLYKTLLRFLENAESANFKIISVS